eukprot:6185695-Pleurochrysis_carterae.AAC.3
MRVILKRGNTKTAKLHKSNEEQEVIERSPGRERSEGAAREVAGCKTNIKVEVGDSRWRRCKRRTKSQASSE